MDLRAFAIGEAQRQGLDPELVLRVMQTESGGNPSAVSPKGARGPMQLMPGTAGDLGVNIDDPQDNIRGGVRYLRRQMDDFGDPKLALAAYNAGPGNVRKYGGVPPFAETRNYVRKTAGGSDMSGFDGADIFGGGAAPGVDQGGDFDGGDIFATSTAQGPASAPKAVGQPGGMNMAGAFPAASDVAALAPTAPKKDQALGFATGFAKPFDNAAMGLSYAADHVGALFGNPHAGQDFDRMFGGPTSAELANKRAAFVQDKAEHGVVPGKIGQFAGNVLGTALMTRGMGPVAAGGASGALLTDNRDPVGVLKDVAIGGVAGKLGDVVMKTGGAVLRGGSKEVQKLLQAGIPLTPGQVLGGAARRIEDNLTSVPIVGDIIAARQAATVPALNRAAADDVLSSIGQKVPAGMEPGHETVKHIGDTLNTSYNKLLSPLKAQLDPAFAHDMQKLAPDIASLAPADQAQIQSILKHQVARRLGNGPISGQALKDVESYLTDQISTFRKGQNTGEMADVLWDVQQAFRDMLARQNPQAAQSLKAHNLAYAKFMRLEGAAAPAVDGVASPAQLRQAVARGAGKRYAARGEGLMQDLANAGAKVIPRTIGNSGTADRLMNGLLGLTSAGATSPVLPLYSGPGQQLVAGLFGGSRPAAVKQVPKLLAPLKTPAVIGASALAVGAAKKPSEQGKKRK